MREPRFWWRKDTSIQAALLAPLGAAFGAVAARRLTRAGARAGAPVVCIGNPTVGGAGKTPAALAAARMLQVDGERPVFLSRGYGGTRAGPVLVDPENHGAADVGDEPLLLARAAPTVVARNRARGAQAAVNAEATVIVMDDGFQNPSLAKDFSVLLIDGRRGLGNRRVIPAGPLRAPLNTQFARAQALIVVGAAAPEVAHIKAQAHAAGLPVFAASLVPDASVVASFRTDRVLAFAGIGDPDKFFATLRNAGVAVAATRSFDDHHRYTGADVQALCRQADREGLMLVTTEKDIARMQGEGETTALAARAQALPVTLQFDDEGGFRMLMRDAIARARVAARMEN